MTGDQLIQLTNARLGGYQNSVKTDTLMDFINEGKDELWAILKTLEGNFFIASTQSTDAAAAEYFAALTTGQREYELPTDFAELKFIEVLTQGYEDIEFHYRPMTHPDFVAARRTSNEDGVEQGQGSYYFDIVGKRTFMLAQYPEITLNAKMWYVKSLPDIESGDDIDEIVVPYVKKIAEYAVKRVMLRNQDQAQFEEWKKEWSSSILLITNSSTPRQSEAEFVIDFEG